MTFLKKILLVDYEPRVAALVRRSLEASGSYLIKAETDCRVAVNTARFFQPDLILFDLAMSHSCARTIAKQMQQDPLLGNTPVVFVGLNAVPEESVVSAGILSGYSFLANPVRIEDFVRYVAELFKIPAELLHAGYRAAS